MKQKRLVSISPPNRELPSHNLVLTALKRIAGLDELVNKVIGVTTPSA